MSSQKNVLDARIEQGTTLTRPTPNHLIFVWHDLSFLKIFCVSFSVCVCKLFFVKDFSGAT